MIDQTGWVWGCEECEFWCETDEQAFAHCDAAKHSLAMRPRKPEFSGTEIPPGGGELPPIPN